MFDEKEYLYAIEEVSLSFGTSGFIGLAGTERSSDVLIMLCARALSAPSARSPVPMLPRFRWQQGWCPRPVRRSAEQFFLL